MSIENIITQLAVLEAEITGVVVAHDETPEALGEFPCFVNYPLVGELHFDAAEFAISDHTIRCELRVARGHLPEAENLARPFITLFRDKMAANLTLNGSVTSIMTIRYEYGVLTWAAGTPKEEKHFGIRFEVDVEHKESVAVGL